MDIKNEMTIKGKISTVIGANGRSAYELAVMKGFDGTLDEWFDSLKGEKPINGVDYNTEEEKAAFAAIILEGEDKRVNAENVRAHRENLRYEAENRRISNEDLRIADERIRQDKENERLTNEANRKSAEQDRAEAEEVRAEDERERRTAELERKANEKSRQEAIRDVGTALDNLIALQNALINKGVG